MKKSFQEFELLVQKLCNPSDFKQNKDKLKELRLSSHETFTSLLKLGGEITTSIRASEEIFKISTETSLTEIQIVELSTRFRMINAIIDERIF